MRARMSETATRPLGFRRRNISVKTAGFCAGGRRLRTQFEVMTLAVLAARVGVEWM